MIFPAKLILQDYAYTLDGGTTTLIFTDERDRQHTLVLTQHAYIPEPEHSSKGLPGRLYFNQELVEVRSSQEHSLLSLLKSAEGLNFPADDRSNPRIETTSPNPLAVDEDVEIFDQTPAELLLLRKVIAFVESDEYVSFSKVVNQRLNGERT